MDEDGPLTEDAVTFVQALDSFVNRMAHSNAAVGELVLRMHRQLQYNVFVLIESILQAWASAPDDYFDPRNYNCRSLARRMLDGAGIPYRWK